MQALVFHGPRDIRYEHYRDPERTIDNAVILAVEACSICGSDLHIYHGDRIGRTDYSADVPAFCVGHEFIGTVVDAGPQVFTVAAGDRVLVAGGSGCGICPACRSRRGRCAKANAFGLSTDLQGGQAEFVQVPNADLTVRAIPEGVSDEQALLLTDALATAHFGTSRADIAPGDRVAIVGLGPIGLLGVELAFLRGASEVLAIDPVAARRHHAEGLGARSLEPGADTVSLVRELTGGAMIDRVFEASGHRSAVELVPQLLRHGGTASFIGLPQGGTALAMNQLLYRNLTVRAGVAPVTEMWSEVIPLLQSGRLRGDGLFTHRLPLSEGAEGYRLFDAREDDVLKVLFTL
ncbi:MAG: alcohol dehydrogenase catalytic domain-containing protein [Acidimicrobiales bacterium]